MKVNNSVLTIEFENQPIDSDVFADFVNSAPKGTKFGEYFEYNEDSQLNIIRLMPRQPLTLEAKFNGDLGIEISHFTFKDGLSFTITEGTDFAIGETGTRLAWRV